MDSQSRYNRHPHPEVPMIAIMWQFEVKAGREAEFEELYGADGAWTAMNRHTRSYLGSSFLHDQNQVSRYIVIEYWSERLVSEPAVSARQRLRRSTRSERHWSSRWNRWASSRPSTCRIASGPRGHNENRHAWPFGRRPAARSSTVVCSTAWLTCSSRIRSPLAFWWSN